MTDLPFSNITTTIKSKLEKHHDLYPALKCNGLQWESILYNSLKTNIKCDGIEWNPGSTGVGVDITVSSPYQTRVSCKSGGLDKSNTVKISGSRHTSLYNTCTSDDEFFEKLSTIKEQDLTACLISPNGSILKPHEQHTQTSRKYIFAIFGDLVDYDSIRWNSFGKSNDFKATDKNGTTVTITRCMSYQAWYYVTLDKAIFKQEIEVQYGKNDD